MGLGYKKVLILQLRDYFPEEKLEKMDVTGLMDLRDKIIEEAERETQIENQAEDLENLEEVYPE